MNITQIIAVPQPKNTGYYWIFGLGQDSNVYIWYEKTGRWKLHQKQEWKQETTRGQGFAHL